MEEAAPPSPPPPPLRAHPYDPTTDTGTGAGAGSEELAAPESSSRVQTEFVDVYLLAPEEERPIELKDFTIMKPKNNKMHRLVRYFPRCEIAYTAAPPPEEKLVTSPRGTTTTTAHRHNGGFSNPSRNAEVFRLKRKLLKDYLAFAHEDDGSATRGGYGAGGADRHFHPTSGLQRAFQRPASPASAASEAHASAPPLPKYTRVEAGDEDAAPLTSDRVPRLSLKARVQYIDSLWPGPAPVDDEDDVMDYYGIEVVIVSEQERERESQAAGHAPPQETKPDASPSPVKPRSADAVAVAAASPPKSVDEDAKEPPEMTVETRSSALQKLKDAELRVSPVASKQDDWVQCDKCQKWRRLPNHVNVSELPAIWYCKMNRWDKRFNKCSTPEEKLVVLMKESDLLEYRERRFALDFLQRAKRLEKALLQYKYADPRDDDGERKFVQCAECLKKRALLGGMDPAKLPQPFVCWMNWDELRASCSAPQGVLPARDSDTVSGAAGVVSSNNGGGGGGCGDDAGEKSAKKSSSKASHVGKHTGPENSSSSNNSKADAAAAASSAGASKKPSKSSAAAGGSTSANSSNNNSNAKRKPTLHIGGTTERASVTSSSSAKKPKRK
ncbi:hypothetical protein PybrP1_010782 [[Pythium] brassicae (nom. inval.)]|nr:hypothetical protein PybrP1_010782 [[Pythium] brassicae (nom. inval.)]